MSPFVKATVTATLLYLSLLLQVRPALQIYQLRRQKKKACTYMDGRKAFQEMGEQSSEQERKGRDLHASSINTVFAFPSSLSKIQRHPALDTNDSLH